MEKRSVERVSETIRVNFYYEKDTYEGTVTDLSYNGLCIDTYACPPCEADIEVVLIMGDEVFQLPGKIKRLANTNELNCCMGVEFSDSSEQYYRFVSTLMEYN